MGDALPWPPIEDAACRAAVPEHAPRLTSCFKPRGPGLSRFITKAVTDLLNVALIAVLGPVQPMGVVELGVVEEGGRRHDD